MLFKKQTSIPLNISFKVSTMLSLLAQQRKLEGHCRRKRYSCSFQLQHGKQQCGSEDTQWLQSLTQSMIPLQPLQSRPSDNLSMALSTWKPVSKGFLPNHQYLDSLYKSLSTAFPWPEGSHLAATPSKSSLPSTYSLSVPKGSPIPCKLTEYPHY